jgi:hypothetical protein
VNWVFSLRSQWHAPSSFALQAIDNVNEIDSRGVGAYILPVLRQAPHITQFRAV